MLNNVFLFQGIYYLITAIWPFVHLASFEAVVGEKPDHFQLYTTSLLILVIAITLLVSLKEEKTKSILVLSIGSALAFMLIELMYASSIRSVFWLDFAAEAAIVLGVVLGIRKQK